MELVGGGSVIDGSPTSSLMETIPFQEFLGVLLYLFGHQGSLPFPKFNLQSVAFTF